MKIQINFLVIFSIWIISLGYLVVSDLDAFILFLTLPPIFAWMLYVSIKKNYLVMAVFFSFIFVSQAINPAIFFLSRNDFIESTQWAVRDFKFDLLQFIWAYKEMYLLLIGIFIFTLILNKIFISRRSRVFTETFNHQFRHVSAFIQNVSKNHNGDARIYTRYIYLFTTFIAIPLGIFMYINGIGISTVAPERLPFKLVGITFYFRNYGIPLVLIYLYARSSRSIMSAALILLYALFVGILSLSKGNIILAALPVILFSCLDGNKLRLVVSTLYVVVLYLLVTWARQFVFVSDVGSVEMVENIFFHILESDFLEWNFMLTFLAAISDRLYGAQYTILVAEYNLDNNIQEMCNYFFANSDNLSQIIYSDLFRLPTLDGIVVGVNIGYLNVLTLLANKNILLILLLAIITAIYLTASEVVVEKYINRNFGLARYPVAFILAFFLYESTIGRFYLILLLSMLALFLVTLLQDRWMKVASEM